MPTSENAPAVLFVTPECAPLIKTGGLADVSAALPAALRRLGIDARVLLPGYRCVRRAVQAGGRGDLPAVEAIAECGVTHLVEAALPSGVPVIVVEHPSLYDRPGGPYQSEAGEDWPDNALRFGLLSKVAAILAGASSPSTGVPKFSTATIGRRVSHPPICALPRRRRSAARRSSRFTTLPTRAPGRRNGSRGSDCRRRAFPARGSSSTAACHS